MSRIHRRKEVPSRRTNSRVSRKDTPRELDEKWSPLSLLEPGDESPAKPLRLESRDKARLILNAAAHGLQRLRVQHPFLNLYLQKTQSRKIGLKTIEAKLDEALFSLSILLEFYLNDDQPTALEELGSFLGPKINEHERSSILNTLTQALAWTQGQKHLHSLVSKEQIWHLVDLLQVLTLTEYEKTSPISLFGLARPADQRICEFLETHLFKQKYIPLLMETSLFGEVVDCHQAQNPTGDSKNLAYEIRRKLSDIDICYLMTKIRRGQEVLMNEVDLALRALEYRLRQEEAKYALVVSKVRGDLQVGENWSGVVDERRERQLINGEIPEQAVSLHQVAAIQRFNPHLTEVPLSEQSEVGEPSQLAVRALQLLAVLNRSSQLLTESDVPARKLSLAFSKAFSLDQSDNLVSVEAGDDPVSFDDFLTPAIGQLQQHGFFNGEDERAKLSASAEEMLMVVQAATLRRLQGLSSEQFSRLLKQLRGSQGQFSHLPLLLWKARLQHLIDTNAKLPDILADGGQQADVDLDSVAQKLLNKFPGRSLHEVDGLIDPVAAMYTEACMAFSSRGTTRKKEEGRQAEAPLGLAVVGPAGGGKTAMVRAVLREMSARYFQVGIQSVITEVNAGGLVDAGIEGLTVEDCLKQILRRVQMELELETLEEAARMVNSGSVVVLVHWEELLNRLVEGLQQNEGSSHTQDTVQSIIVEMLSLLDPKGSGSIINVKEGTSFAGGQIRKQLEFHPEHVLHVLIGSLDALEELENLLESARGELLKKMRGGKSGLNRRLSTVQLRARTAEQLIHAWYSPRSQRQGLKNRLLDYLGNTYHSLLPDQILFTKQADLVVEAEIRRSNVKGEQYTVLDNVFRKIFKLIRRLSLEDIKQNMYIHQTKGTRIFMIDAQLLARAFAFTERELDEILLQRN